MQFLSRLAALSLILAGPVQASALADDAAAASARQAYESGRWAEAETLASNAQDAELGTLAAQSVLAPLMTGELAASPRSEKRETARRAQARAREALERDSGHAPAHLRLAAGIGYEARYVNMLRAAMMRLPQQGREHIEAAMALDPSDPWGPAMFGAWHMEVARRAGDGRFGADPDAGITLYRQALEMEGGEPAIPYHFALALIAADPAAHGDEALALLDRVRSYEGGGAFGAAMRTLAMSLRELLEDDPAAAQAEAVRRLEQ